MGALRRLPRPQRRDRPLRGLRAGRGTAARARDKPGERGERGPGSPGAPGAHHRRGRHARRRGHRSVGGALLEKFRNRSYERGTGWVSAPQTRRYEMNENLEKAAQLGQGIWIDSISRDDLEEGGALHAMIEDGVVRVTSNPSIFQKAISESELYDEQLEE